MAPNIPFDVYVDYAHTPDAIEKAIAAAREQARGRVSIVFGCEGDRDTTKRPKMAAASLAADKVFLTNDNAHSERVLDVLGQVKESYPPKTFKGAYSQKVTMIADRKAAFKAAMNEAHPGDVILICGRGHEDKMMFGADTVHFDDMNEARYALLMYAAEHGLEAR